MSENKTKSEGIKATINTQKLNLNQNPHPAKAESTSTLQGGISEKPTKALEGFADKPTDFFDSSRTGLQIIHFTPIPPKEGSTDKPAEDPAPQGRDQESPSKSLPHSSEQGLQMNQRVKPADN